MNTFITKGIGCTLTTNFETKDRVSITQKKISVSTYTSLWIVFHNLHTYLLGTYTTEPFIVFIWQPLHFLIFLFLVTDSANDMNTNAYKAAVHKVHERTIYEPSNALPFYVRDCGGGWACFESRHKDWRFYYLSVNTRFTEPDVVMEWSLNPMVSFKVTILQKLNYLSIRHACAETNCCGGWFAGFRDDKQIFPNKIPHINHIECLKKITLRN